MTLVLFTALTNGWHSFHDRMPAKPITFLALVILFFLNLVVLYTEGNTSTYLVIQTTCTKVLALMIFFNGLISVELLLDRLSKYSAKI